MATRQRQREREGEREQPKTNQCQECGGQLVNDEKHGEKSCRDCGLVVQSEKIDRGPDWRAFNSQEKQQKSRTGAAMTNLKHDKGLSTKIDWKNQDGYGNSLGSRQRKKMQRLRTWNERWRAKDPQDRNLKTALGEIDRMASALGIPKSTRKIAATLYRRCLEEDMLRGRSIEAVGSASLWIATRQVGQPKTLDEISHVSRVDRLEISRARQYIERELNLGIPPATPNDFIPKLASELNISDPAESFALELSKLVVESGIHSGKSPSGMAAACIYISCREIDHESKTQREISEAADVTEVTIRNRYQEILKESNEEGLTNLPIFSE